MSLQLVAEVKPCCCSALKCVEIIHLIHFKDNSGVTPKQLGFLDAGASSLFATMMAKFVTYDCGKTLPDVLYLRTSFFFSFFFSLL